MTARRARNTTRQGANFELQIMDDLARRGYDVLRSSGSRGKVDVVALGDGQTLFIQAKISQPLIPPAERRGLIGLTGRTLEGWPVVAYRVRGNVCYRVLTGLGPKEFVPFEPEICWRAECSVCLAPFWGHVEPGTAGRACPGRLDGTFTLRERKDRMRKPKEETA